MSEEELKQKYRYLRNRLYNIRDKVNNVIDNHNETYTKLKDFILIDNKILNEDEFFEYKKLEQHVVNELNSIVIPSINNKI